MKVKIQAVRWEISPEITIGSFCEHIKDKQGSGKGCKIENAVTFKGWPRFIFVNRKGDYWIILMMTLKSPRGTILANTASDGVLSFISNDPEENASKIAEFNYLLIHKTTGVGVYSSYHGATAFDRFTSFFREAYRGLKEDRIDAEVAAALLTKETASKLVQDLKAIDYVSLSFDSIAGEGGFLTPYRDLARSSLHVIRFSQKTSITEAREAVVKTLTSFPNIRGSVHGTRKDGLDKLISLRTNLGVVDEFEHNEAIKAWNFDPENLAAGAVVKRMMKVVEIDPARFVTKVKVTRPLPEVEDIEADEE